MSQSPWAWLRPPEYDDVGAATTAALLHWVSLAVCVLTVVVTVLTAIIYRGDPNQLIGNFATLLLVVGTQVLLRRGHAVLAAQLFILALWSIITAVFFFRGGIQSGLQATYFPAVATTSVLTSRKAGVWLALASAAVVAVMFLAESQGYRPVSVFTPLTSFVVVAFALLMTGGVSYIGARVRESQLARVIASDRARQASETRYAELIRSAPDGIMLIGPTGDVLSANPATGTVLGVPVEDLIGRPFSSLPGLVDVEGAGLHEAVVRRADGTARSVEVESVVLPMNETFGLRVSIRDVSARRDAERERDKVKAQLQQSQKIESIGMLAGGVAHDFNNLITVLFANVELLRDAVGADANARESLAEIEAASQHAAELTRQLLAFSRRQALAPKDISLNDVIEGLRKLLRRLLPENISLHIELEARGFVRADPGQLEQVIINLAANARDAMPGGGSLLLRTADVNAGAPHDGAVRPQTLLRVTDTGTGIEPEVLARVFEPFFTTKGPGAGTGLGLAVVEGVVRQSGGAIRVESSAAGTTFEILLPQIAVAPTALGPASLVKAPVPAVQTPQRTVLLIEDEAPVRVVIARLLERAGYVVVNAADGIDALDVAGAHDGVIDLVISDHIMPRMSGPETVTELRRRRRGLPVLFISGYTGGPLNDVAALGDGTRFLQKPFSTDDFLAVVHELLERPLRV